MDALHSCKANSPSSPLTVRKTTPLLKAGALMLTHDLNQLGVVDEDGALIGVVGHSTVAKALPRFLL